MQKLDESVVLRLLQEEWEKRKVSLREELETTFKVKGEEIPQTIISPGLKVNHKKTGMLCTIDSVGLSGVIMKKPEGTKFVVSTEQFEKEFELQ